MTAMKKNIGHLNKKAIFSVYQMTAIYNKNKNFSELFSLDFEIPSLIMKVFLKQR